MRKLLAVFLLLCACVEIETSSGIEVGHDVEDGAVIELLGIRYAEPPTGERRFAAPVMRAKQTEKHNASAKGESCEKSEDCLFLNVWAPKNAKSLPVMLFIHGGGYTMGSAPDAAKLAKKGGVVTVTINYRLGVFGFLAHESLPETNFGLLDQQLAMRWVRDNISAFGGDPSNVTLFGESAGAGSVCAHLSSPLAKDLFQRAIAESGSCRLGFLAKERAQLTGAHLAEKLGCQGDVPACLRAASRDELAAAIPVKIEFAYAEDKWVPSADGAVIPVDYEDAFRRGEFNRVPFLSGVNGNEGSLFTVGMKLDTRADFEELVRDAVPEGADGIIAFYPEATYPKARDAATALLSDAFVCGQRKQALLVAPHVADTYLYQFTRVNPSLSWNLGSTHGSEIPYVFGDIGFPLTWTKEDGALSDAMIGYWTRFAKTGSPSGNGSVDWPRFTVLDELYLELDLTVSAKAKLQAERCDVLDSMLITL